MSATRRQFETAAAASLLAAAGGRAAPPRPNVLILHCHDLGQFLNCYGVKTVQSPNLDRFAAGGVLFERSFCSAPQCSPSRASIFTGRYPHSNGVMGLTHAEFAWDLGPSEQHLGEILKAAGYRTEAVGVVHETRSPVARIGIDRHAPNGRAAAVAENTILRLREFARNPGQPFYMQAGCIEPHRLAPPAPDADLGFIDQTVEADDSLGVSVPPYLRGTHGTRTEIAELQGAVRHMDRHIGRILDALEELRLAENTLTVFTTDHGIAVPRAKCSLYEPGLQTACIVRLPSRPGWHGGVRRREMISNIDYLPTMLEVLGLPAPPGVQGRSFAPLLDGRRYTARDAIFSELTYHNHYDPRRAVRTETHKLIVNFSAAPAFMDPSQSWRPRSDTVTPPNPARTYHPVAELYDLAHDPWEQKDIAREPAAAPALKQLQARLAKHLRETRDPILEGAVTSPMHRKAVEWLSRV